MVKVSNLPSHADPQKIIPQDFFLLIILENQQLQPPSSQYEIWDTLQRRAAAGPALTW